ncbi:glycine betaine ABC transporter substrate-binding protein [Lachnotalea glycerini]|uniref:Glycine/betaine ABC transporter substrate-binding protein n=1 Tax=Lachnotalea glycerini TaxID=1763509 RepID=A0A371JFB6_9FIRM|nr:glycine betaine ABC transporter substrate-binding protein [Lachnotalea glycerini]RDY31449.1 glycine/betaine ABC transporter substrate-binding protein [Lachnotalea glycerini]
MKKKFIMLLAAVMMIGTLTACTSDNNKETSAGNNEDINSETDADSKEEKKTVKLAYVNWSEGIAMTNLAAAILEDKMGYEVDMTMADIAPVFTSIASGNTDAFLDVWLPVTHKEYMEKYGDDVVDLGVSYENARLGVVVPSYVEINSIEELNDNKDLFGGKIVGIDAGAGLMTATENAIQEYGLEYDLLTGSGTTMTAALGKAIEANEPIVVTGWSPHWKFARWDLKFLEDPKGVFGEVENIHIITRKGLEEDQPKVVEFLKSFKLTESDLGDLMGAIEEDTREPLDVARDWMNAHDELVQGWMIQ